MATIMNENGFDQYIGECTCPKDEQGYKIDFVVAEVVCPYGADLYDDYEPSCNCCAYCQQQCADGI